MIKFVDLLQIYKFCRIMRIAFVHGRFPAGGAERITIDIARYLKDCGGYEVYVYTSRLNREMMPAGLEDVLKVRKLPSQAVQRNRSKAIEEFINEDRIDILVQVTKPVSGIEGIRQRTGCKAIVACHGEPFWQRHAIVYRRQKGFFRKLMWHLYNKRRFQDGKLAMEMAKKRTLKHYKGCDAYTVLCDAYKRETELALGIRPEDSHIFAIENSELPARDCNLQKENLILFCGRLENWSKRVDRLLRIWEKVQDRLPQWKLEIVGDGEDSNMLRKMAEELELERVSFEGMSTDVAKYYSRASIVCLTSETEGWVLALTEAQANGCIGIAFGCTSGIREILSPDGECGFIVPPFDEDAYADTLVRIAMLDEEEKLRIRKNSIEKRLKYCPDVIARKWKDLFDNLCPCDEAV
jgi:glycosyltransferase involved in cell wall biosynthesis